MRNASTRLEAQQTVAYATKIQKFIK